MLVFRGFRRQNPGIIGGHAPYLQAVVEVSTDGISWCSLPWRCDVVNHSPTGFEWGYLGSGPAQLALAILVRTLRNKERAVLLHHRFSREVIAQMPRHEWHLSVDQITKWFVESHSPF